MLHALKVLEFSHVLERLVSQCETQLGAELCAELKPSFLKDDVWILLDRTEEASELITLSAPPSLAPVRDHRKAVTRAKRGGVLGGQELFDIGAGLSAMRSFRNFLNAKKESSPRLWGYGENLPDCRKVEEALLDSLEQNGDLRDNASPQLATLRQRRQSAQQRLMDRVQSYISGRTRELLSDPIYTVRDGRYVIPLKAENRGKIKGIVHDSSATGQTIFIEPEDVLQLGNALREIEGAERAEIQRILTNLSSRVGSIADEYVGGVESAAWIDVSLAKARLGADTGGCRPERVQTPFIQIEGGRHPLLNPEIAVPLDIEVGQGTNVLITGPNTGGKTVSIKTVGLFVLMAQCGLMPPARNIRFGPFTQIWADIGDEQSLNQSLSTFSGHIKNIAEAIRGLKSGALVLLDEVGAGTDPAEGAALAKSILTELHTKGACVLASTHYGELKAFAYETEGFQNAAMEFDTKTLRPTYKLRLGAPGASQALRIAERYGIPLNVVEGAREALSTQHQDVALMMERLEQSQKLARQAQGEADRRLAELRKKEELSARKLAEADEIRRTAHSKAQAIIEDALREIRLDAAEIFEDLKKYPHRVDGARKRLKDLQDAGSGLAQSFAAALPTREPAATIAKGMSVRVEGYTQVGLVLDEPKNGEALVQMGIMRVKLPLRDLTPMATPMRAARSKANISLQKAMNATTELHLRHQRFEDAERELERFVDDALLSGVPSIRIVHGKGEGVLRKMTQEFLRKHKEVASYHDADAAEGGHGVTIAVFK